MPSVCRFGERPRDDAGARCNFSPPPSTPSSPGTRRPRAAHSPRRATTHTTPSRRPRTSAQVGPATGATCAPPCSPTTAPPALRHHHVTAQPQVSSGTECFSGVPNISADHSAENSRFQHNVRDGRSRVCLRATGQAVCVGRKRRSRVRLLGTDPRRLPSRGHQPSAHGTNATTLARYYRPAPQSRPVTCSSSALPAACTTSGSPSAAQPWCTHPTLRRTCPNRRLPRPQGFPWRLPAGIRLGQVIVSRRSEHLHVFSSSRRALLRSSALPAQCSKAKSTVARAVRLHPGECTTTLTLTLASRS
jgi:hypothetical protein